MSAAGRGAGVNRPWANISRRQHCATLTAGHEAAAAARIPRGAAAERDLQGAAAQPAVGGTHQEYACLGPTAAVLHCQAAQTVGRRVTLSWVPA